MGSSKNKAVTFRTFLFVCAVTLLSGCTTTQQVKTTDPLKNVVTQEVFVPVAACPVQVNQVDIPERPMLPIDSLTAADQMNFKKVAQAYMQTVVELQLYAGKLEGAVHGIKDICNTVNNNNARK